MSDAPRSPLPPLPPLPEEETRTLEQAATQLSAVVIPGAAGPPGSALADVRGPQRAAADVRRLGAAVQSWVVAARRAADKLDAADRSTADHLLAR